MKEHRPRSRDRDGFRRRLVQDPADPGAVADADWPPMTRPGLTRCARSIQRAVLLLGSQAEPDRAVHARVSNMQYRVRELIQLIRSRARRVADIETWSVATASGQAVRFPLAEGPASVFREIAGRYADGYERAMNDYIAARLGEGDVFIDIGAHVGYTSAFAAATGATVYAIEVQRDLIPLIEQMAILNGFDQLRVFHAGMSDRPGVTMIRRMTAHPGFRVDNDIVGLDDVPGSIGNDAVPLLTLNDTFAEPPLQPAMIKIDVEGHEMRVLAGASRIIERARTVFVIEYHPHILEEWGQSASDLLGFFPAERWQWYQLTETALRPVQSADEIEADPRDPNPKIVFEPRSAVDDTGARRA